MIVNKKIPGHPFFQGIRGQAVGSGQVDQLDLGFVHGKKTGFLFHGDARIVGDMLPGAVSMLNTVDLPQLGCPARATRALRFMRLDLHLMGFAAANAQKIPVDFKLHRIP